MGGMVVWLDSRECGIVGLGGREVWLWEGGKGWIGGWDGWFTG